MKVLFYAGVAVAHETVFDRRDSGVQTGKAALQLTIHNSNLKPTAIWGKDNRMMSNRVIAFGGYMVQLQTDRHET